MTLPLVDPLLDNKILIRIVVTIHYKLCDFVDHIYLALNLEQRIPLICARSASYIGIHIENVSFYFRRASSGVSRVWQVGHVP